MSKVYLTPSAVREWARSPITSLFLKVCTDRYREAGEQTLNAHILPSTDAIGLKVTQNGAIRGILSQFIFEDDLISFLGDFMEVPDESDRI